MLGCIIKREVPMPNTIFSQDKPGSLRLRNDTRPQHRGCLATKANVLPAAGPLMADDKSGGIGSLTVLDANGRKVAARFAEAGPYFQVGFYARASGCVGGNTIRDGKRIATQTALKKSKSQPSSACKT